MRNTRLIASRAGLLVALSASVWACDTRFGVTTGGIRLPDVEVPTGVYQLRTVDDVPLPHVTTGFGTVYSLVTGSFELTDDSVWAFHSVTVVTTPNGTPLGTSPANYVGTWTVTDSIIELRNPVSGTIRIRKDTLFWTGGPKFAWEQPLTFALTK